MRTSQNPGSDAIGALAAAAPVDALSPALLTEIFDHLDEAVVVADTDRRMVYVNAAAEALFGYERAALLGRETRMLYADPADFSEQGRRRFNPDSTVTTENYRLSYRRAGGGVFLALTTGAAMRASDGTVVGFIGIVRPARSADESLVSLQRLHAVHADASRTRSEQIEGVLEVGLEHFGLETAIQSRVDGHDYLVEHCVDSTGQLTAGTRFDLSGTYCVHTMAASGPVGFHFAGESEIRYHPCYRDLGLESYIGCPIVVAGQSYGTINFSGRAPTEPFSRDDYILIEILADTLGYILHRKHSDEALWRLAQTDALTGVANRRAILATLDGLGRLARRSGMPLTVVAIDLDHFKRINDTHGHAGGDAALADFARIASGLLRDVDACGRMGGEEFLLVLPDTGAAGGVVVAERLRRQLAAEPIDVGGGEAVVLKFSGGVASLGDEETIDGLIARADAAAYDAKRSGRDRILVHEGSGA